MPLTIYVPVVTADGSVLYTSDGYRVVVAAEGNAVALTQLPVLAAYDYRVLQPFLNTTALAWATPEREP